MTNTLHFFIESGKLMVMEHVPDIANFYDRGMPILDHAIQFEQALQKAKQSAIEVDNQDEVGRKLGISGTYSKAVMDRIYSLEGCRMEAKYEWGGEDNWESAAESVYNYWITSDPHLCRKLALIHFEEPKKEESQEDLWTEIETDPSYIDWNYQHLNIELLKERFKIERIKQ